MASFQIQYHTLNLYDHVSNEAYLDFLILPCHNDEQYCTKTEVSNNLGIRPHYSGNLYGFKKMSFSIRKPFQSFELFLTANAETRNIQKGPVKNLSIKDEFFIIEMKKNDVDFFEFYQFSDFVISLEKLLSEEISRQTNESCFAFVQRMNHWVRNFLSYEVGATNTKTTMNQLIELRKGVCQDYVHFFNSIMRTNGIASRYVSGYLFDQKSSLQSAAMHAWAEVWVPAMGWVGIDPVNNQFVNENYIKVAHGKDYSDCMPVSGIVRPGAMGVSNYEVQVIQQ